MFRRVVSATSSSLDCSPALCAVGVDAGAIRWTRGEGVPLKLWYGKADLEAGGFGIGGAGTPGGSSEKMAAEK